MLERFFSSTYVLNRLRDGALGEFVDDLAAHLHERGHSRRVAQAYICATGHFAHWLVGERIPPTALDEKTATRFIEEHLPVCECSVPTGSRCHLRPGLAQLLIVLRERGCISARPVKELSPVDTLIAAFDAHLASTCGAAVATRHLYTKFIRRFLEPRHGVGPVTLTNLRASELVGFVSRLAEHSKPATIHVMRTALRSFIRFAQLHGLCSGGLAEAVPKVACWRRASLPTCLTEKQLSTLLDSFDRSSATGLRNYAMALCLAQLGLRAGDVARLTLDDLDWRAGTLRLDIDKERRATVLPLPAIVGRAIVAYLRRGRPETRDRHVFVRHALPIGREIGAQAVSTAIRQALKRANISAPSFGSHILRRTAATRMVRAGASLKQVADILRHRSLNTVMIYTKVDLPRLAEVALPWPEVQS